MSARIPFAAAPSRRRVYCRPVTAVRLSLRLRPDRWEERGCAIAAQPRPGAR